MKANALFSNFRPGDPPHAALALLQKAALEQPERVGSLSAVRKFYPRFYGRLWYLDLLKQAEDVISKSLRSLGVQAKVSLTRHGTPYGRWSKLTTDELVAEIQKLGIVSPGDCMKRYPGLYRVIRADSTIKARVYSRLKWCGNKMDNQGRTRGYKARKIPPCSNMSVHHEALKEVTRDTKRQCAFARRMQLADEISQKLSPIAKKLLTVEDWSRLSPDTYALAERHKVVRRVCRKLTIQPRSRGPSILKGRLGDTLKNQVAFLAED